MHAYKSTYKLIYPPGGLESKRWQSKPKGPAPAVWAPITAWPGSLRLWISFGQCKYKHILITFTYRPDNNNNNNDNNNYNNYNNIKVLMSAQCIKYPMTHTEQRNLCGRTVYVVPVQCVHVGLKGSRLSLVVQIIYLPLHFFCACVCVCVCV